MKFFFGLVPLVGLFYLLQGAWGKPMEVSNVDCAGEYMSCLDREGSANPFKSISDTRKGCKAQIRELAVCQGLPAYRTEDNIAL